MWRWVTRGLVLTVLAISLTPAVHAQDFIAALDQPDPNVTWSGVIPVRGFVLDPGQVTKIELYVTISSSRSSTTVCRESTSSRPTPTIRGSRTSRPAS